MTRILAFTDPHGSLEAASKILALARRERPDAIVCAGDFSYFGTKYDAFLTGLRALEQDILYVNGNHETEETQREVRTWYPFMRNLEYTILELAGLRFGGLPATGEYWPGEDVDDAAVNSAIAMLGKGQGKPFVLLSHYPPWMSSIAGYTVMTPDSGGSRTVLRIIDALKPTLLVSGHYHQDFGKSDVIGRTRLVNPGPNGMMLEVPSTSEEGGRTV